MSKQRKLLKKKKDKALKAKSKVLKKREVLRGERRTKEQLARLKYQNRERLEPIRNE